jgi:hypothetical protein
MKTVSLSVALGAVALTFASTGYAQAQGEPLQQQPAQTQPVQSVTVQPQPGPQATSPVLVAPNQNTAGEKRTEHLPNTTLLSTGIGLFALSYIPTVIVAAASSRDADQNLYIPVVGPWIDLGERTCSGSCGALLVTSGIAQDLGVLLAASGLFVPTVDRTTDVRTTISGWQVVPTFVRAGAGIGAIRRF